MSSMTFHLVSLGCPKNTVDSASMARLLQNAGFSPTDDPKKAAFLIVNTCGFIEPARVESLQVLEELASNKHKGQVLIAAGCLTQRYGALVANWVPGIDGVIGTRRWMDIVQLVQDLCDGKRPRPLCHLPEASSVDREDGGIPRSSVHGMSAYLKIADGCRRPCAFCAIPLIKGPAISRPMDLILKDAHELQKLGVHELVLLAQDTTDYGHDLGIKDGLSLLLEKLVSAVPQIEWIRIMYAYPGNISDRLIEVMASHPQILHYLDLPLQHAHPAVLHRMRRPTNVERVCRTLEKMRLAMPDIALRTTFLVGYPGEGEAEFQTLLDFVREIRFDKVGVFQFSFEQGTPSEPLGDPIPAEVKKERYERLMELQQAISLQKNQAQIGRTLTVLVEGYGDGLSFGRSYRDAPEIDGLVIIEDELAVGRMMPIRITGAMIYDLTGTADLGQA